MREMSKTYAACVYASLCIVAGSSLTGGQATTDADASRSTCAALLSDSATGVRLSPASSDSVQNNPDTTARGRSDTATFGYGGARTGTADILLRVGIHADEVRFAKQPHVRVRLCWGGDTLRVVQRDNLPSPVVAGTTYRDVYVAVELVGRVNAECLADIIGVGNNVQQTAAQRGNVAVARTSTNSPGSCAFLGGAAGAGAQSPRPPGP